MPKNKIVSLYSNSGLGWAKGNKETILLEKTQNRIFLQSVYKDYQTHKSLLRRYINLGHFVS